MLAVEAALALARKHTATASLAAVLLPLSAVPAHAIRANVAPTITATFGHDGAQQQIFYQVTNSSSRVEITRIELPEYHAGDIDFTGFQGGSGGLPNGWIATEFAAPQIPGTGPYVGFAGEYVDLTTSGYGIGPGGSALTFAANIPTANVTSAELGLGYNDGSVILVDPPIPNTNSVPEPTTWALMMVGFGAVGAAMRARLGTFGRGRRAA